MKVDVEMRTWWMILAERAAWERLGDRFSESREVTWETWLGLFAPVVLIAILIGVAKWWQRRVRNLSASGPKALFRELADAHKLTWRERQLLGRLAKATRTPYTAHVFLDRSLYENQSARRQLGKAWPTLMTIRDKLFAQSPGAQ